MIADDHAILRSGLRLLVNAQADMEVVSEAPDGEQAVQAAHDTKPDVALMDLTMPGTGGMRALQEILRDCPKTRVLVLTMHDDPAYLRSALSAGTQLQAEDFAALEDISGARRAAGDAPASESGWKRPGR
jgi:two-component system response regulator NreC